MLQRKYLYKTSVAMKLHNVTPKPAALEWAPELLKLFFPSLKYHHGNFCSFCLLSIQITRAKYNTCRRTFFLRKRLSKLATSKNVQGGGGFCFFFI